MKKLANLSIGTRLGLSFAIVLGLMAAMALASIYQLRQIGQLNLEMQTMAQRFAIVEKWQGAVQLNLNRALTLGHSGYHPATVDYLSPQIKETTEQVNRLQDQLDKAITEPAERALFVAVGDKRKAYLAARGQAVDLFKAEKVEEGLAQVKGAMTETATAYLAAITALQQHDQAHAAALAAEVLKRDQHAQWLMVVVGLGAVGIAAWMGWSMTRSVTRPLGFVIDAAERIAGHDLNFTPRQSERRDEIGQLQRALGSMHQSLTQMVRQIRVGTDSVATASGEIAAAGTDLSTRTENTSSALQQTASTMEQITTTVGQTAESARTANQLASSASDVARRGGEVVGQVVSTMDEINASSKRIADIIGTIDGIAFQTNILALNAAVEAARAGEQGRGFAVVAGEVRSLAQRSAEAAREIKTLIGNSVDRVETGARLVAQAGTTMEEIVHSVHRVSDIIGEVMAATSEQSQGINLVNQSVSQLDQMTQQNAALVEETAAAAAQLREQSGHLADLVATFRLQDATSGGGASTAQAITSSLLQRTAKAAKSKPAASARTPAQASAAARKSSPSTSSTTTPSATKPAPAAAKPAAPATAAAAQGDSDWETF
ncbi:MAG: methyl-accepting chemotaxis protein [Rubrivivax sp.]